MFSTVIEFMFKMWNLYSKTHTSIKCLLDTDMRKWREDAKKFYNIYSGKRCFIIGNGPSLSKQDLSELKNEICFCCNLMAFTNAYDVLQPRYYFLSDPDFFSTELSVKVLEKLETKVKMPELFVPYWGAKEWVNRVCMQDDKRRSSIHCFIEKGIFLENIPFYSDMRSGISPAYTVTQTAAMIAVFMGFAEIYLLGCDGTGIYENMAVWQGLKRSNSGLFHFDDNATDYFTEDKSNYNDIIDTLESHKNTFIGYKRLEMLCNQKERTLCNLTEGGIIRYIPCGLLENVLKEKDENH